MTNPNNAIGTNGAYSGRTSPNALNDITAAYSKGIISGWACSPKSGMTVQLGGASGTRDVALAQDNAGNKLTIDNRSAAPVDVTISGAPATNSRIDCIVAYVDNPSTGDGSTTDNPTTCGIIAVSGTVAANPTAPNDTTIRAAITTDGATGGSAYYVILATIAVGTGVTTIGSGVITQGDTATSANIDIADGSIGTAKLASGTVTAAKTAFGGNYSTTEVDTGFTWIDGKTIYKKTINFGALPNASQKSVAHGISNLDTIVDVSFVAKNPTASSWTYVPATSVNATANQIAYVISSTNVTCVSGTNYSAFSSSYVTLWYTKTS